MIRQVLTRVTPAALRSAVKRNLKPATREKIKLLLLIEKKRQIKEWRDIPVVINNRNRFTYLMDLIAWLERVGVKNIYLLDNASTYPPLLEYYQKTPHTVLRLGKNVGHKALWKSDYYTLFKHNYFIYTDPDVVPDAACPDDAIALLWKKLKQYERQTEKIGLGLKIDDLPAHFNLKDKVVNWEKQYWTNDVDEDLYKANVDTTFALYRPYAPHNHSDGYRMKPPYLLKHQPWYLNYDNLPEEELYYLNNVTISSTIGLVRNQGIEYQSIETHK